MRIVFMGTPDFASAHLQALVDEGFDICGVFTQPDKPRNRGMKLSFSPVKEVALAHDLPVFQPVTLRDGTALEQLKALAPELLVVVAYGKILPDEILDLPEKGSINIHASLLPRHRGSAPVQWSVLCGDELAGVTSMYMASEVDSGDMIYQEETPVGEYETSGELFDRLRDMGAKLLVRTVRDIEAGIAPRIPQDPAQVTFTTQLSKEMSPIDWNKTPRQIVKHICGLDPWPVATTVLQGETMRVFRAAYTQNHTEKAPGQLVSAGKQGIEVACAGGETLLITELQAPGKKRMAAASWLLGHPLQVEP